MDRRTFFSVVASGVACISSGVGLTRRKWVTGPRNYVVVRGASVDATRGAHFSSMEAAQSALGGNLVERGECITFELLHGGGVNAVVQKV
jgi:hypothetical protein